MEKYFFLPPVRPLTDEQCHRRTVRVAQAETLLAHEPGGHRQPRKTEMQLLQRFVDGEILLLRAQVHLRALRTCPFFRWHRANLVVWHPCLPVAPFAGSCLH